MVRSPAEWFWICLPLAFPATLAAQFTVQLAPRTDRQFIDYQQAAEAKMDWQAHLSPAPGEVLIAAGAEAAVTGVPGGAQFVLHTRGEPRPLPRQRPGRRLLNYGYSPRILIASATRPMPTMLAATRMPTFRST
jgi:hypothetical protein